MPPDAPQPTGNREDEDLKAYNPDQSIEERRIIQQGIRRLERDMHENTEDYLQPTSTKVYDALETLNGYAENIKQTNEAAIESKALLTLVDFASRKMARLTGGNHGNGIDADEFVSRAITYMRQAQGISVGEEEDLTHTQRHRRAVVDDDSDEEGGAGGDALDWTHLGRYACVPNVRRPGLPGFMLGPLSVQKKVRKVVARTAPLRVRDIQEVRPEVLRTEDFAKSEKQDLTAICNKILKQLKHRMTTSHAELAKIQQEQGDDAVEVALERLGITDEGNVDLVRFCINPWSFGQTVENMFYVSFLIREGMVHVQYEENGLPSLCKFPVTASALGSFVSNIECLGPSSAEERDQNKTSKYGTMKHQAVLSIDMPIWRELIKTYNIKEPMIEHRKEIETRGPGARGWYS